MSSRGVFPLPSLSAAAAGTFWAGSRALEAAGTSRCWHLGVGAASAAQQRARNLFFFLILVRGRSGHWVFCASRRQQQDALGFFGCFLGDVVPSFGHRSELRSIERAGERSGGS